VHVYASQDSKTSKFIHIATESSFKALKPFTDDGFVYIKVGALTPVNGPDRLDDRNMIEFDIAVVKKNLFPSNVIPILYRDEAFNNKIS